MNKNSDEIIKQAFHFRADAIEASPVIKQRIDQVLLKETGNNPNYERKGNKPMKWNFKKAAVLVAGLSLLTTGVCFASGKFTGYITVADSRNSEVNGDFNAVEDAEQEAGINVAALESFNNGYTFEGVNVITTAACNEGEQMYDFNQIILEYANGDLPMISVFAEDAVYLETEEREHQLIRECDGIEIMYNQDTYKFVPEDYTLTDEDIALEAGGNYYISYGSDEVVIKQHSSVTWVKDGVFYNMLGFDLTLSAEELMDMAEEMIHAE